MKLLTITLAAFILTSILALHLPESISVKRKKPSQLYAGKSLSDWYAQRSYPGNTISMEGITEGFNAMSQNNFRTASVFPGTWEPIGPKNFGGRTLALCFNPVNPETIFAGSASGGLWRTYSEGTGVQAWHQVATGFPVLGIAAIAINPQDTNEMYIGTGEVYNDQNTGTGFAIRTTRGTYGIGILKSVDGGITWSKSLDWQYDELKGIQDIIINPLRPATLFAATTEGTYRSYDSGQNWSLIHNIRMGTDLLMMPNDTSIVFVAAGNSFSNNPGIYRSADGGTTFTQMTNGVPMFYSGKAMIDVCASDPDILVASIGEQLSGLGLYRSEDGGFNWFQANPTDFQVHQGWFSHDVLIKPSDPDIVIAAGMEVFKSDDGGFTLNQKSYWDLWDFDLTVVGGSEGPPDYVHADVHRLYSHPQNDDIVYLATDGGVFRSYDSGETFEACNGGYQTQQFYANFSSSSTDTLFAIGGLQDNATAVYEGNDGWRRVIGGDGLSTAIDPNDDQIVYGSSQYLNLRRSDDKAQSFNSISVPGNGSNPFTNFAGPFVLCPSDPTILYGGRDKVYKSTNSGQSWFATNNNNVLDGNAVLAIEVADNNENLVYASTAPVIVPDAGLFKTINGGLTWTNVTAGIPNRYIMDMLIDHTNNNTVFAVVSGFGTPHLFKTINGGTTWNAFGNGLPDVPVNTIAMDPLNNLIMYLGSDIGIYYSIDGGLNWIAFNDGLIDGTFVMDISISPLNRKLRLATHGKGVFERDMLPVTITGLDETAEQFEIETGPNPATNYIDVIFYDLTGVKNLTVYDCSGKTIMKLKESGDKCRINLEGIASGKYFIRAERGTAFQSKTFIKL